MRGRPWPWRLLLQARSTDGNERHLVFRDAGRGVRAQDKPVSWVHRAERHGVVGHDQGSIVIDEDDDMNALLQIVLRPILQIIKIGLLAPRGRRAGINLHVNEFILRKDGDHHLRLLRLPVRRQRLLGSPEAIERGALARKAVVDRAALAGRAMLAPFARGLADLGNIVDFAAKRAAPTFSSGNQLRKGPQIHWGGNRHSNSILERDES